MRLHVFAAETACHLASTCSTPFGCDQALLDRLAQNWSNLRPLIEQKIASGTM